MTVERILYLRMCMSTVEVVIKGNIVALVVRVCTIHPFCFMDSLRVSPSCLEHRGTWPWGLV